TKARKAEIPTSKSKSTNSQSTKQDNTGRDREGFVSTHIASGRGMLIAKNRERPKRKIREG
ncbi:MAG: hypothetical protein ACRC9E_17850, partial [Plesiomonas shigelloides]